MLTTFHRGRRTLRIVVFLALAATVLVTFAINGPLWERVRLGELPMWLPFVAPAMFTLFVIAFSIDRYVQVRRRNYPVARAMIQLGLAVVFLAFLWPQQARELLAAREKPSLRTAVELLRHRHPSVRALACEALRADPNGSGAIESHIRVESDERVIARCQSALTAPRNP
ncbi:MAG: hypothetical protein AAF219_04915 [Myxococcota bacterium]